MNDGLDDMDYLHIDVGSDTTPMEDGSIMRNEREVDCSVDSTNSETCDGIDDFNINDKTLPPTMEECGLCEGNTYDSYNDLETDILSWGRSCGILKLAGKFELDQRFRDINRKKWQKNVESIHKFKAKKLDDTRRESNGSKGSKM